MKVAHRAQAVVTTLEELVEVNGDERVQRGDDGLLHGGARGNAVGLGAARGLLHDLVDRTEPLQIRRGDLQGLGRCGRLGAVAPEDAVALTAAPEYTTGAAR